MLNQITVMGRLVRDPELRMTTSNTAVSNFTVACDRDIRNNNGERETDFLDIVAFGKTAEFVHSYFQKGSTAVVNGRLQIRSWTDNAGNNRRNAEIIANSVYFGDSNKKQSNNDSSSDANDDYAAPIRPIAFADGSATQVSLTGDLPF